MKPFISVIVPIYNAEQFLEKCILSIRNQTYQNLQIVLVDDGSTDRSPRICDRHSKEDARIVVIHKRNGGVVSARKAGVHAAEGNFIGWVDADDWVEPDYFEQMARRQEESGADIVSAALFHDIGMDSGRVRDNIPAGIYRREQLLPQLIYSGKFFEYGLQPHLYTKLIRKEILDKTQMAVDERVYAGEDAAVVYPSVLEAGKICITDICGYHYVQHQGSMTKTGNSDEWDRFRIFTGGLEEVFERKGVMEVMRPQLEQYKKYFLLLRQVHVLDQQVLLPFGGIPVSSRVIIYGAGVLGQRIYQYLKSNNLAEILLWVDRNYGNYREKGMDVNHPENIKNLNENYDYILIANITESTADSIRNYLMRDLQVPVEKIRWLSEEFVKGTGIWVGYKL